jgi:hypothetical protein
MARKAPRIHGAEDLLALMREGEVKRTRLLGSWHTGSEEDGCNSMVFLINPPTEEEYQQWQEMASQLQSAGDGGKEAEMRKAINAMDKGFAFGDTPMYVKVMVPDAPGREVSIMSGLVQSENNVSHNEDGSVSVANLQKFKIQTSDRVSKNSRFGHLVDFGGNYQTEK